MTALVIGATGLVGSSLVQQLLDDPRFDLVKVLARRNTGKKHKKLEEHTIDFDHPETYKSLVTGNVLFSCLGTTIRKAGSRQAQYKIDHDYQYEVAKAAAENGVPVYVLVSAAMASEKSRIFYSRMKGELERDIEKLGFSYIHIIRPGILTGHRNESRMGEKLGIAVIRFLNRLGTIKSQRPIPAATVAKATINVSFHKSEKISAYNLLQVFREAGESI